MGRKPNPLISAHFERGEKLANNSNRYAHTCIHCRREYPKGRPEVLISHLTKCPALSPGARQAILTQADSTQQTSRSDFDESYIHHQNVGLQQLADVAEAAGAASVRNALTADHAIPLDPQLSAPTNPNGNSVIIPQFSGHNYYAPAVPYPTNEHDIATTTSSLYPNLTGPPVSEGTSSYPAFPTLPMAHYHVPFTQYAASGQLPTTSASELANIAAGAAFDVFSQPTPDVMPTGLPSVSPLDNLDPSFAPSTAETPEMIEHSAGGTSTKGRKAKEPYSPDKRLKIANVRRVKPCIRCSRLQKSCSINKPCGECLKVQTNKNWIGPCTKFKNSVDFDEWYEPRLAAELDLFNQNLQTQYELQKSSGQCAEIVVKGIDSEPIVVPVILAHENGGTDSLWVLEPGVQMKLAIKTYLDANIELLIKQIPLPELSATLRRAYDLTKGKKIPLAKVTAGQELPGDDNLRAIIELWFTVHYISSPPWAITIRDVHQSVVVTDDSNNDSSSSAAAKSLTHIRLSLAACLEAAIAETRTLPTSASQAGAGNTSTNNGNGNNNEDQEYAGVLHDFDVTRISSSGHKEFHNLLLGIVLVLGAVERYCAWMHDRTGTGTLPDQCREKAEEYARKYVYAVRGISILPPLSVSTSNETLGGGDGARPRSVLVPKYDTITTGGNTGKRTLNYSLTKAYVEELSLGAEDLGARVAEGEGAGGRQRDGWLWGRIFMAMVE